VKPLRASSPPSRQVEWQSPPKMATRCAAERSRSPPLVGHWSPPQPPGTVPQAPPLVSQAPKVSPSFWSM